MPIDPKEYLPIWASHSERWLNCPGEPFVTRAAMKIKRPQQDYTRDGIRAHAIRAGILADKLPEEFLKPSEIPRNKKGETLPVEEWIPEDQLALVQESAAAAKMMATIGGLEMHIERSLPLDVAGRRLNCKIDQLNIGPRDVWVIDYKNGSGRPVRVEGNPQLGVYALAVRRLYPDKHIHVGIDQPRTGMGAIQFESLSNEYLDGLKLNLNAAVRRVIASPEQGMQFNVGPWCSMCDGLKGYCPKQLEISLRIPGDETPSYGPWWVLDVRAQLKSWIEGVCDEAFHVVESGQSIPGWVVRPAEGNRRWANPKGVADTLAMLTGADKSEFLHPPEDKPRGIIDNFKLARKYGLSEKDLESLVYKPTIRKLVKIEEGSEIESPYKMGAVE